MALDFFSEDNDHHQRVLGAVEHLVGLEAVKPLDELESARQRHQRLQLLGEDHPGPVLLVVAPHGAVLDHLEVHVLPEDLRDGVDRFQRREGGANVVLRSLRLIRRYFRLSKGNCADAGSSDEEAEQDFPRRSRTKVDGIAAFRGAAAMDHWADQIMSQA